MLRIVVTSSRDWTDRQVVHGALRSEVGGEEDVTLVSGACPTGGDRIAEEIFAEWQAPIERHPADWERYGKRAGFVRNAEMVASGIDVCVAFIRPCVKPACRRPKPHGSHGATMTADLAEKAGIRVVRYYQGFDDAVPVLLAGDSAGSASASTEGGLSVDSSDGSVGVQAGGAPEPA